MSREFKFPAVTLLLVALSGVFALATGCTTPVMSTEPDQLQVTRSADANGYFALTLRPYKNPYSGKWPSYTFVIREIRSNEIAELSLPSEKVAAGAGGSQALVYQVKVGTYIIDKVSVTHAGWTIPGGARFPLSTFDIAWNAQATPAVIGVGDVLHYALLSDVSKIEKRPNGDMGFHFLANLQFDKPDRDAWERWNAVLKGRNVRYQRHAQGRPPEFPRLVWDKQADEQHLANIQRLLKTVTIEKCKDLPDVDLPVEFNLRLSHDGKLEELALAGDARKIPNAVISCIESQVTAIAFPPHPADEVTSLRLNYQLKKKTTKTWR